MRKESKSALVLPNLLAVYDEHGKFIREEWYQIDYTHQKLSRREKGDL